MCAVEVMFWSGLCILEDDEVHFAFHPGFALSGSSTLLVFGKHQFLDSV